MKNDFIAKETMTLMKVDSLDAEKRQEVLAIKDSLELSTESTLEFGSSASKCLTEFSSDLLKTMKIKDTPEVEEMMASLLTGLSEVDANTLLEAKPSFIKKLFKIDEVKSFIVRYEDVSSVIGEVKKKLEQAQYQLKKDTELCNRYLEQNMHYINELDKYILAGKLRVEEEKQILKEEQASIDMEDMMAVHTLSLKQGEVDRLERKIHDLELMRQIGVQNIPQIALIKEGDSVLIEKITSSINSAIPLWESQMIIAIQIMRQKGALAIQRGVTDTTNKLLTKNSELLKLGSVEVARELERGIVDVEVLKKTTQNLIETLDGIRQVREEGYQKRIQATHEIGELQGKLNESLLLPNK